MRVWPHSPTAPALEHQTSSQHRTLDTKPYKLRPFLPHSTNSHTLTAFGHRLTIYPAVINHLDGTDGDNETQADEQEQEELQTEMEEQEVEDPDSEDRESD